MFNQLSDRFEGALKKLSGQGRITEANVREAMEEVRDALLEADVHYEVAEEFCERVSQQAVGTQVLQALKPGQQMIKIVNDELVNLLAGDDQAEIEAEESNRPHLMYVEPGPTIIMMAGLQGSGKTTTCGKLAGYLKKKGKSVMLAAADLQRPAAVDQLQTVTAQVRDEMPGPGGAAANASANANASTAGAARENALDNGGSAQPAHGTPKNSGQPAIHFYSEPDKVAEYGQAVGAAVDVARNAVKQAKQHNLDVLILDTAGRLHLNEALMDELRKVSAAVNPHHIMLVIDAMTGQDAVNSAKAFNDQLELDSVILTKFDSDTRGGAALTVKKVTGKPIKFTGTGEQLDALEEFHPSRAASRILGMGDVVSLVERAQEQVSEEEAQALEQKMAKGELTMDDFLKQLRNVRKMGSMKSLLGMMPGIGKEIANMDLDEREVDRTEAIIESMTTDERRNKVALSNSRRRRVAEGSGRSNKDVSHLMSGFEQMSKMSKQMSAMGGMDQLKAAKNMAANASAGNKLKGSTKSNRNTRYKQRKRKRK